MEDFHRCKQVSENLEDSDEPADVEEDVPEDPGQAEKPEAPGHVRLLVQVGNGVAPSTQGPGTGR